jgi:hypothetical protein
MLLTQEVEVDISGNNQKYYEKLGYDIPRKKNEKYKIVVPKGTTIKVKVEDLPKNSTKKVEVLCDYCKKVTIPKSYRKYISERQVIEKDCCKKCQSKKYKEWLNTWG